jgi:negative regulator of sigma E activity
MNDAQQQNEGLTSDEIALMLGHQLLQLRMNNKQIEAQQAIIQKLMQAVPPTEPKK